ncbi:uncharacterized protein LOC114310582 [Camellia sinensis]|uniref:uncharacterized protein LOC114310582 n=1 Tax=Camellia sinensis TaxID=4442 RepID=UPI0010360D3F|nr:uncharacterized protein LOC114310582 [Camellia sinensis]
MAKRRNVERMAAHRKAKAEQNQPLRPPPDAREETPPALVEEVVQTVVAETEPVARRIAEIGRRQYDAIKQIGLLTARVKNKKGKAAEASLKAESEAIKVAVERARANAKEDKAKATDRLRLAAEERTGASEEALKLAKRQLQVAGRIAEIGRRQYDAIKQIGLLTAEMKNEKGKAAEASLKAESEAIKVAVERARANAKEDKAKATDRLRLAAEERTGASEEALKLANETIGKLEADLEESRRAMANAESKISKSFQAGKDAALADYAEEVPKFENREFKQGWFKALAAANVVSEQPILYEQVDVEPLASNPED